MPLDIQTRQVGDTTVVSVRGRVVFGQECNILRNEVKELLPQTTSIVLNLEGVEYVDSGGVGTLVALFTSARNAGVEFRLACANPRVKHVLQITKLLPILGLLDDEAAAIESCRKHANA
jgi:anti-sigma B factor antagonist